MPKPKKNELAAARLNSLYKLLSFFGVFNMYLFTEASKGHFQSSRESLFITYTTKAQKMIKPAMKKVEHILKKYLGCTGG